MSKVLPKNYSDARSRFLKAAEQGFTLTSYTLPDLLGPSGEALICDVAMDHVEGSEIAVVTSSAIHGVEGYAGSVLQESFMREERAAGRWISRIHVHALNPYGFAYDRRADSDNFDVNRNFLESYPAQAVADEYQEYADIIVPKPHNNKLLTELKLAYFALTQQARMKDIITRGQSSCADGMYYTGLKPSWSRGVWSRIVADHLSRYKQVFHLDIHTGLGDPGELQLMGASTLNSDVNLVKAVWGDRLAFMRDDDGRNTTLSSPTVGEIQSYWKFMDGPKPPDAITYVMEFGTLPPLDVFKALRADHAAHARGETNLTMRAQIAKQMRAAFAPSDASWIDKVVHLGTEAYHTLLTALEKKAS